MVFRRIHTWSEALSLSSTTTDSKSSLYLPVSFPVRREKMNDFASPGQ